jgi:hypothetical protein
MSCNYYRGKCLFLNGKEDGCKGCPIKKAYNNGVRDTKKDYRQQGEWIKVKENRMSIDMSGELVTQYKCSKCGRGIATLPSKLADYPFCHCGADMRG